MTVLKKWVSKAKILSPPGPWVKSRHREGQGRKVVLLHGLWRSPASMEPMAEWLHSSDGRTCLNVSYPSVTQPEEQGSYHIESILLEHLDDGPVDFVTHSLGGVVLRGLLASSNRHWTLGKAVMLAPPNNGSQTIDWVGGSPLRHLLGPAGEYLKTVTIHQSIPSLIEAEKVAVIMGKNDQLKLFSSFLEAQNDGIVSVEDGRVDGLSQFMVEEADHTFIMINPRVQKFVSDFLKL